MTALSLVAVGLGFAVCAWVTASATSGWSLSTIRRRRRIVAWFIAVAGVCQFAAAVVLMIGGGS